MQVEEQATEMMDMAVALGMTYGMSVVWAILTLLLGLWFAGAARRLVLRGFRKSGKVDDTVAIFIASIIRYVVIAVTVLAVLDRFGIQTTSFIAILGTLGLAVGLAIQGTLSNVASGVMLMIFRPFKVGHYVETAGTAGTVKAITLFTTDLDTSDNKRIIVPNSKVWGDTITNYSHHDTRRVDIQVGVSYDADLNVTKALIEGLLAADERVLADPAPGLAIAELGDSAVIFNVRPWTASGDYWAFRADFLKAFKEGCDAKGIDIPYPTQTIHTISNS